MTVLPESFGDQPTSTALATLDEHARRHLRRSTCTGTCPTVPLPEGTGHVHTGSIGTVLQPGAQSVTDGPVRGPRARHGVLRPQHPPQDHGRARAVRARVEELVRLSDVVKASGDDLA